MMNGLEYWAEVMKIEKGMIVTEIRVLRWMSMVTREDKIIN